jgi:predicted PurR-regulated permease PerM
MEGEGKRSFWKIEPLLGGLALLLLLVGCFFVLRPFMTALMWAIILAYSLHPLQRVFTRWFRGSRTLAACLVTLTVTVLLAGPVTLIGFSIAQDSKDLASATRNWFMAIPDQPPAWVARVPVFGDPVEENWITLAEGRKTWMNQLEKQVKKEAKKEEKKLETTLKAIPVTEELIPFQPEQQETTLPKQEQPPEEPAAAEDKKTDTSQVVGLLGRFLTNVYSWLLSAGKTVAQGVMQVLLSAFLAFFLLRDSDILAVRLGVAVERLAGDRGRHLIKVAGDTVRGVVYGILGTAIVQALVAGLGFWIAGVPGAVLLSVLTFFFAVLPFGPPLIWLPASLWLFAQDKPGLGVFMLLWGFLGISSVDNFLRPYLISQGSKMPFALIFCGVIGGALGFGLVGVFLGPTLLAVVFRLIEEWSSNGPGKQADLSADEISELPAVPGSATPPHGGESLGVG